MKQISDFQRLETHGIWRESKGDPGRSVVVQLSARHLTIVSKDNQPLAHWSLDAVRHLNPGGLPAVFTPDDHAGESVEMSDSDVIGLLCDQLGPGMKNGTSPPRTSWAVRLYVLAFLTAVGAGIFVFSGEIAGELAGLIPAAQRLETGERAFSFLTEMTGGRCRTAAGDRALAKLESRLFPGGATVRVVRGDAAMTTHLPGGILAVSDALLNEHDRIAVTAGYLLEENLRAVRSDPMAVLFRAAGLRAAALFALRGRLDDSDLREFTESQVLSGRTPVEPEALLEAFGTAGLSSSPFALATGSNGRLLELDPYRGRAFQPPLSDREWFDLRNICR